MALSWKARRRWSLVLLLVWLPLYIAAALLVVSLFDRPPFWVEALVYAGLGIIWALPFRAVFRGVGREPPEDESG
jgi:membrane protein implicated in regulation of membrane protease activity